MEGECEFLSTSQLGLTRICGLGSRGEALLALRAECGISAREKGRSGLVLERPCSALINSRKVKVILFIWLSGSTNPSGFLSPRCWIDEPANV